MKIKWLALLLIVLFFHDGYSQKIDWNDSIPKYISATGAKLSLNKDFVKEVLLFNGNGHRLRY